MRGGRFGCGRGGGRGSGRGCGKWGIEVGRWRRTALHHPCFFTTGYGKV